MGKTLVNGQENNKIMTEIERFIMKFGGKSKYTGLLIGTMKSNTTCMIGAQEFMDDDLMISSHLKHELCTKVNVDTEHVDNSQYIPALKEGDTVIVYPLNDEKMVILDVIEEL